MNPKFILKGLLLTLAFFGILSGALNASHAAEASQPGTRPTAVETENGYYYTVQKGDTLWDLSRRFSTTPWVWPELWEENSDTISNPHLIYPGQKIRLTRIAGGRRTGAAGALLKRRSPAFITIFRPSTSTASYAKCRWLRMGSFLNCRIPADR